MSDTATATKVNPDIELPKPEGAGAVVVHRDPERDNLLSVIRDAARDKDFDVAKFQLLVQMQRDAEDREASRQFDIAMADVQNKVTSIIPNATNPQTKSKYATLAKLDAALRPLYAPHGFAISFGTADGAPAEHVRVTAHVSRAGHGRDYFIDMPADGKGARGGDVMTKTHAVGSGVTYGRRYLLLMIFNIPVERDDDGNAATTGPSEKISPAQVNTIQKLIVDVGADIKRFLAYGKVERIEDISVAAYPGAVSMLKKFGKQQEAKK